MQLKFFYILTLVLILSASGRICLAKQEEDLNLLLGNPSKATAGIKNSGNFLVQHNGYTLSYNRERGAANWVAWHLSKIDLFGTSRTNAFAPDMSLPEAWRIKPNDYAGSGFDRGHLCPSADRIDTDENNRETFLMSNMQPQRANVNRITWEKLEESIRRIIKRGNEAYIYAGCYGDAGRIKVKITIPTRCFKVVLLLPDVEGDDLKRINAETRVIAVDMPNDDNLSPDWRDYLITTDRIEAETGFNFFSKVAKKIQAKIEARKDN